MQPMDEELMYRPCETHEMMWCAICNGDLRRQEQDEKEVFRGLQILAEENK